MTDRTKPAHGDGKTLVTFLLDRSGSMGAVRQSTIEAFNGYLDGLKADAEGIDFTFLQFDTESLDKLCVAEPVARVAPLSLETYVPRGGTPLIDAAYKTIRAVEAAVAADGSDPKVVICIQTDGEENSSTEHTWEALSALVHLKIADGWQFNFMGAGIDAYAQGAKMGIAAVQTMSYDHARPEAARAAFAASAANAQDYRRSRTVSTAYSPAQRVASGDRFARSDLTRPKAAGTPPRREDPAAAGPDLDLARNSQPGTNANARRKTVSDFSL